MKLLTTLKKQYQNQFSPTAPRTIDDILQLFVQVLDWDMGIAYGSLKSTVLDNMERAFDPTHKNFANKTSLKVLAGDLEVFGKKIVEMKERTLVNLLNGKTYVYLRRVVPYLGFADDERLYDIRNFETHNDDFLTTAEYFLQLERVICWYFRFVDQHYAALAAVVTPPPINLEPYFRFLEDLQRAHQSAFVDLELQEHIRMLAKEQLAPDARQKSITKTVSELQAEVKRRRNQVQMMLLGAAGMGKTMSLLELVIREVAQYRRGRSERVPMYLHLSDYDPNSSLEQVCAGNCFRWESRCRCRHG